MITVEAQPPLGRPAWIWPRAAYIHVPFCAHHCGYCDFAVIAGRDHLMDRYLAALEAEMSFVLSPAALPVERDAPPKSGRAGRPSKSGRDEGPPTPCIGGGTPATPLSLRDRGGGEGGAPIASGPDSVPLSPQRVDTIFIGGGTPT